MRKHFGLSICTGLVPVSLLLAMADRQLLLEAERVKADQIRAERRAAELAAANALRQPEPG